VLIGVETMMDAQSHRRPAPRPNSLTVLGRAILLIEEVSMAARPLGVTELSRRTGIPKTTTHRLLEVLLLNRLFARDEGGIVLGPGLRRLAQLAHDRTSDELQHLLAPYLLELYERTGEVVTLGVLDNEEVVILQTVRGHQHHRLIPALDRLPVHCTAIGKLLLAHLDTLPERDDDRLTAYTPATVTSWSALVAQLPAIRAEGMAICADEYLTGVTDVAAAIVGRDGRIAGLGRMHHTGTSDGATNQIHRQIAMTASTALLRHVPPRQRQQPADS
jgi:DNA-binding IclR family transcriptional regulator